MRKVLVVDDDRATRKTLARFLASNCLVQTASNGAEALDLFPGSECPFDVVVTDCDMPIIGGVELTAKLKEKFPGLWIVLMSGNPEPEQHKGDLFLGKPFNVEVLETLINRS